MSYTALVLAARRPGVIDPLSQSEGVTHKCLIDIGGKPMIRRVVETLAASPEIGRILISIDEASALDGIAPIPLLRAEGRVRIVAASGDLFDSVRRALLAEGDWPALVTTADNALMTPEMIAHFVESFEAGGAEIGVGVTPAEVVWAKYPDGQRRPHRFRDGSVSSCNIFAMKHPQVMHAARAFEGGGQFGKSKLRVLKAFGPVNLLLYISKRLTLEAVFRRISARFGVRIAPVNMPFAEAPIDVDNARTALIARAITAARQEAERFAEAERRRALAARARETVPAPRQLQITTSTR